ncbi:uncharacterized protein N7483_004546 [Penicillium malachiteum]|uniref:uncharacterized protein n=1 Tax=Penicillium malachiteum TaxID=1324776 RepID=UPI002548AFD4|nr:uncharacterized protein N7483_004546 [Penicillium malachiteum]KAJ5730038.1 hypothetical protein N7483_004546 [Penicillium malachiteum]
MKSPPPPSTNRSSLYPDQDVRVIVPASIGTIQTERLYLRFIQLSDATDIFDYTSRQDVADFLWPKIPHMDIQETEAMIQRKTFQTVDASGALGRCFTFAIIQRDDPAQKVIGAVGINALVPAPSVGYGIHPDFWGKGYMSEAVAGVIDAWWKLERECGEEVDQSVEKLYAACNKANVGSVKVLLKNGFTIYEEIPLEGDTVALFSLERS